MNPKGDSHDLAFAQMTLDIVRQILSHTGDLPTVVANLLDWIREMSGLRTIIMIGCREGETPAYRILGVSPRRRRAFADLNEVARLSEIACGLSEAAIWRPNNGTDETGTIVDELDCGLTLAVPLMIEGARIGAMLIFGLRDDRFLPSIVEMHNTISSAVALNLQNAFLIEGEKDIIDNLQRVQSDLRDSEKYYRAIAEDIPVLLCRYLPNGEITYVNESYGKYFSKTPEELVGSSFVMQIPEADREKVVADLSALTAESPSRSFEHQVTSPNGDIRCQYWTNHALFDADGRTVAFQSVGEDITERKRAEEKLQESEKKYRNLVETSQDLIFSCDREGRFTYLNLAWEDALGYTVGEMMGRRFAEFKPPEVAEKDADTFKSILEGRDTFGYETIYLSKTGERRNLLFNARILRDSTGGVLGTHGAAYDFTERKQTEEEKSRLEEEYNQANKLESIGRLAGGVAHDFNNLLSIVTGYSDIIAAALEPNDPLAADVNEIQKAAASAAQLTSQLLAFSRKQTIDPKVVDINETVRRSQKMFTRLIEENIDLLFVPSKTLWKTKIDPGQLDQILLNLVINSRDAMPDGGKLTIKTANTSIDEAYCATHRSAKPGEFVRMTVSDSGCGMEKEMLDNIFEPFFTTKGKEKGTGLGLSTVYGIVMQHGGTIEAHSEPDQGTSIEIFLPRAQEEVDDIIKHAAEIPLGGSETVLLAEDEDQVRKLVARILKQSGYHVLQANNGSEAYLTSKGYERDIHLLLTDVVMPEMNGKELYEKIASMRKGMKVLYLSGYTNDAIAHHGVLNENTAFLQKPFSAVDLLRKVREALDE